ncbi:MAG: hypothetical protein HF975_04185 [ANME-2 cluster archaeon]|nr:hypothetical protein [ANME-2 cluster archaeon]
MVQLILDDNLYTFDASTKEITLAAPYNALSEGQVLKIKNLTTHAVIYEAESQRHPISVSGAVITHTYDNTRHSDTDLLQITIDAGGSGSTPVIVEQAEEEASGYESITVTDSAIGLTPAEYGDATIAQMTLETGQIRVRKDGTNPTSSEGHPVQIGDQINLYNAADIAAFKAIRTGSVSGVLKVTYSE